MDKKAIGIIIIILAIIIGFWWMLSSQGEMDEPTENAPEPNKKEDQQPVENGKEPTEGEVSESDESDTVEESKDKEEGPYGKAEVVEPKDERNVAMHKDLSSILGEIFEEEPKLISTGEVDALMYIVNRPITADDGATMKDLLGDKGYEIESSKTMEKEYRLNVSTKILEQEYDGNIYIRLWTTKEGENTQKIEVRVL